KCDWSSDVCSSDLAHYDGENLQPDPSALEVLAVVVREVPPDALLEPLLSERPAQHRLAVERPCGRFDDDGQVLRHGGAHLHHGRRAYAAWAAPAEEGPAPGSGGPVP